MLVADALSQPDVAGMLLDPARVVADQSEGAETLQLTPTAFHVSCSSHLLTHAGGH